MPDTYGNREDDASLLSVHFRRSNFRCSVQLPPQTVRFMCLSSSPSVLFVSVLTVLALPLCNVCSSFGYSSRCGCILLDPFVSLPFVGYVA